MARNWDAIINGTSETSSKRNWDLIKEQSMPTPFVPTGTVEEESPQESKPSGLLDAAKNVGKVSLLDVIKAGVGYFTRKPEEVKKDTQEFAKTQKASFGYGLSDAATLGLNRKLDTESYDMAKQSNPNTYTAGELTGYIVPGTAAEKATSAILKPVIGTVEKSLAKRAAADAGTGIMLGTAEGVINGESTEEKIKRAAMYGATGAGMGLALGVAGRAIPKLIPKKPVIEPKLPEGLHPGQVIGDVVLPNKSLNLPDEIPLKRNVKVFADGSLETAPLNPLAKSGRVKAIDLQLFKAEPNNAVGTRPNMTLQPSKAGSKTRSFANTVVNSEVATPELISKLKKQVPTYEPITNIDTLNNAKRTFESNPDEAFNYFRGLNELRTAEDTALGEVLIQKAVEGGNINEARLLTVDLAEKLTNAGQIVQAASIMKRMTPEGMLMYAQRTINRANKEMESIGGKLAKKAKLDNNVSDFIVKKMQKINELPEGREKDIAFGQVMKTISDQLPVSLSKKVSSFQTISMLANPKTMIRNASGNLIFGGAENISNVIGAGIDKGVSVFTGKRTTLLPSLSTQVKGLTRGAKEAVEDFKLGIDTSPNRTQYDLPQQQVFKGKIMGTAEKLTGLGLKLGDRPFWQAAYDEGLRQQMKIVNVTKPTTEMMDKAKQLADYRTYQDVNKVTQLFQGAKNALNKVGTKDFGLGDLVLKFPKTPANILARAIDYSPVGVLNVAKVAYKAATKNGFDQKAFVDSLARVTTGSGAILLGYELAKNGVITGRGNKDTDVATLERNAGKGDYSFNIGALKRLIGGGDAKTQVGDTFQTYDWAQPMSIPLAIGADIFMSGKDKNSASTVAIDALRSGGETLFKQSLLQGLQRFMGGYSPVDNIAETLVNAPAGFVPSLAKQGSQLSDSTARNTYDPDITRQGMNLIKSKIPVLSSKLQPKIDTSGKDIQLYQGKNNLFNVAINPGFTTQYNPSPVQQEVLRIYNSSGNREQFPKVADKSFTWKEQKIQLTPEEYTQYQRTLGQITDREFGLMMNQPFYKKYSDEQKAKVLQGIITDANAIAKTQILKQRGLIK